MMRKFSGAIYIINRVRLQSGDFSVLFYSQTEKGEGSRVFTATEGLASLFTSFLFLDMAKTCLELRHMMKNLFLTSIPSFYLKIIRNRG